MRLLRLFLIFGFSIIYLPLLAQQSRQEIYSKIRRAEVLSESGVKNDRKEAFAIISGIKSGAILENDLWAIGFSSQAMGYFYYRSKQDVKAFQSLYDAINYSQMADTVDHYLIGSGMEMMGTICNQYDLYESSIYFKRQALMYFDQCITLHGYKIGKRREFPSHFYRLKYFLASNYLAIDSVAIGLDILHEVYHNAQLENDDLNRDRALNMLGGHYSEVGQYDSAKYYFSKLINDSGTVKKYKAFAYQNLSKLHVKLNELDQAHDRIKKSILLHGRHSGKRYRFRALRDLGNIYMELGELKHALEIFQRAIKLFPESDKPEEYIVYQTISQLYEREGEFPLAETYKSLFEERKNQYQRKEALILQEGVREKFMALIEKLKDNKIRKEVARDYTLYAILCSIFLAGVIAFYFLRRRMTQKRAMIRKLGDILLDD